METEKAPVEEQQVEPVETQPELSLEEELSQAFDDMATEEEVAADPESVDEEVVEEVTAESEETEEVTEEIEEAAWDEPAPERWPDEIKDVYNKLPVDARKAMLEGIFKPMQRAYTQNTQELAQMRGKVEPMLQSLDQYKNDFERMGMNPVEAFQRQMAWAAHFSRVGPEQGIVDMRAAYGMNQSEPGQQEQYLTPVERAMQAKLDQLEQQVHGQQHQRATDMQQQTQQALHSRAMEVQTGLQQFMNEQKDGKPAHPHLEKVAPAIAGLIRGGLVSQSDEYGQPVPVRDVVAQAYRMACDMDSSVRSPRLGGQVERAAAAQNAEVVTTQPSGVPDVQEMSLEQSIDNLYDQLDRKAS